MSDIAIRVEDLGKKYRLGGSRRSYRTVREAITDAVTAPMRRARGLLQGEGLSGQRADEFWALRDVSFEVKRGEVVGIIGRNGAGKSTLLKILARITKPTTGYADIYGRVGSLLEVGTGFHPELSGRENIYLSGAVLGMKRAEIDRRFDEIVDFAEVEKFIDTPVKHYSSGMYLRLAFAVAAHLEPEILLVDEVLAVGDAAFQKKCLGKMGNVAREGRTVLFVSHNMAAVQQLCHRCIWLEQGEFIAEGEPRQLAKQYLSQYNDLLSDGVITYDMHQNASGEFYFHRVKLHNYKGQHTNVLLTGEPLRLSIEYEITEAVEATRLIVVIERMDGTLVTVLHYPQNGSESSIGRQSGHFVAQLDVDLHLAPGGYIIQLAAKPLPGYWTVGRSYDWVRQALNFHVEEISLDGAGILPTDGIVSPETYWSIERAAEPIRQLTP